MQKPLANPQKANDQTDQLTGFRVTCTRLEILICCREVLIVLRFSFSALKSRCKSQTLISPPSVRPSFLPSVCNTRVESG